MGTAVVKGPRGRKGPGSASASGNGRGHGAIAGKAAAGDPWRQYLARHHLKLSRTREEVVAAFMEMPGHVDLAQLHARVKTRNPSIGLATVYRALKLMEDAGIVEVRRFEDRSASYEVVIGREHHDHLICEHCGDILEFSDPEIERIQEETAQAHGFVLVRHRHELFGLCQDCRRQGAPAPGRPRRA